MPNISKILKEIMPFTGKRKVEPISTQVPCITFFGTGKVFRSRQ